MTATDRAPPKALLNRAVQQMRLYLGSVDYCRVQDQIKLRNALDQSLNKIAEITTMQPVFVWEQIEAEARKYGVVRPQPGKDI